MRIHPLLPCVSLLLAAVGARAGELTPVRWPKPLGEAAVTVDHQGRMEAGVVVHFSDAGIGVRLGAAAEPVTVPWRAWSHEDAAQLMLLAMDWSDSAQWLALSEALSRMPGGRERAALALRQALIRNDTLTDEVAPRVRGWSARDQVQRDAEASRPLCLSPGAPAPAAPWAGAFARVSHGLPVANPFVLRATLKNGAKIEGRVVGVGETGLVLAPVGKATAFQTLAWADAKPQDALNWVRRAMAGAKPLAASHWVMERVAKQLGDAKEQSMAYVHIGRTYRLSTREINQFWGNPAVVNPLFKLVVWPMTVGDKTWHYPPQASDPPFTLADAQDMSDDAGGRLSLALLAASHGGPAWLVEQAFADACIWHSDLIHAWPEIRLLADACSAPAIKPRGLCQPAPAANPVVAYTGEVRQEGQRRLREWMQKEVAPPYPGLKFKESARFMVLSDGGDLDELVDNSEAACELLIPVFGRPAGDNPWLNKCAAVRLEKKADFQALYGALYPGSDIFKLRPDVVALASGVTCNSGGDVGVYGHKTLNDPFNMQVVIHELAHQFLTRWRPGQVASWANEGFAELCVARLASKVRNRACGEMLARVEGSRQVVQGTGSCDNFFAAGIIEGNQYGMAFEMADCLERMDAKRYGTMLAWLLEPGVDSDEAMRRAYGFSQAEFVAAYGAWIGLPKLKAH